MKPDTNTQWFHLWSAVAMAGLLMAGWSIVSAADDAVVALLGGFLLTDGAVNAYRTLVSR